MPPCPVDRQCVWTVNAPHHDWWTTDSAVWLLAFVILAAIALVGLSVYLRYKARSDELFYKRYPAATHRPEDTAKMRAAGGGD